MLPSVSPAFQEHNQIHAMPCQELFLNYKGLVKLPYWELWIKLILSLGSHLAIEMRTRSLKRQDERSIDVRNLFTKKEEHSTHSLRAQVRWQEGLLVFTDMPIALCKVHWWHIETKLLLRVELVQTENSFHCEFLHFVYFQKIPSYFFKFIFKIISWFTFSLVERMIYIKSFYYSLN